MSGLLHAPTALTPAKNRFVYLICGLLGPATGMDAVDKSYIFCPSWELNYGYSIIQAEV
jgi:hypothetical protein